MTALINATPLLPISATWSAVATRTRKQSQCDCRGRQQRSDAVTLLCCSCTGEQRRRGGKAISRRSVKGECVIQ